VQFIEPPLTWAEQLAMQIKVRAVKAFMPASAEHLSLARLARRLEPFEREAARWERLSSPDNRYAYCFCAVD
jgi:hypothetical protein